MQLSAISQIYQSESHNTIFQYFINYLLNLLFIIFIIYLLQWMFVWCFVSVIYSEWLGSEAV